MAIVFNSLRSTTEVIARSDSNCCELAISLASKNRPLSRVLSVAQTNDKGDTAGPTRISSRPTGYDRCFCRVLCSHMILCKSLLQKGATCEVLNHGRHTQV